MSYLSSKDLFSMPNNSCLKFRASDVIIGLLLKKGEHICSIKALFLRTFCDYNGKNKQF